MPLDVNSTTRAKFWFVGTDQKSLENVFYSLEEAHLHYSPRWTAIHIHAINAPDQNIWKRDEVAL